MISQKKKASRGQRGVLTLSPPLQFAQYFRMSDPSMTTLLFIHNKKGSVCHKSDGNTPTCCPTSILHTKNQRLQNSRMC